MGRAGQAEAPRPRMGSRYYDSGEQRAAKVNALFSSIAPRYDLLNDIQSLGLHRYWKRRVIQLAGARPGLRALDICCGTGDLALALARCGAETVGLDFSERMLELAGHRRQEGEVRRRKPGRRPEPGKPLRGVAGSPHFVRGDAQRLPFADDSFDLVTVGYGLRNLASWESGLREMQRVAKPGGRLVALDFGKPDNALWRGVYYGYLGLFVPLLGRVLGGSARAYAYILESLHHFPAPDDLAARMRALGLAKVRVVKLLGGVMAIHCGEKTLFWGGEDLLLQA